MLKASRYWSIRRPYAGHTPACSVTSRACAIRSGPRSRCKIVRRCPSIGERRSTSNANRGWHRSSQSIRAADRRVAPIDPVGPCHRSLAPPAIGADEPFVPDQHAMARSRDTTTATPSGRSRVLHAIAAQAAQHLGHLASSLNPECGRAFVWWARFTRNVVGRGDEGWRAYGRVVSFGRPWPILPCLRGGL